MAAIEPGAIVLVTGASGFVGRATLAALRAAGLRVRALVRPGSARPPALADGVEAVAGDVTDAASVAAAARGCAAAVHLVGILRERGGATFEAVHVGGTRHVLAACRQAGLRRLVHLSALGVGRGVGTPYFRTKEAAEEAVRAGGLDWTVLRPSVLHGPKGDFMVQMARMVARPGPVPLVGRGDQILQPLWVEDVGRAVAAAVARGAGAGRTVEMGGPDVLTLREFYTILSRVLRGRPKRLVPVPTALVRLGAWAAGRVLADPPVTPDELTMLLAARPCDTGPMREAFGFEPAPFEPTLAGYAGELRAAAGLA